MLLPRFLLILCVPFTFAAIPEQLGALALCAQVCVTSGLLNCGCGPTDFECSCNCPMFIPFSRNCLNLACSPYRVNPSLNTLNTICSPFTSTATTAEPQTSTASFSSSSSSPTTTLLTSSSSAIPTKPQNTLSTTTSEQGGTVITSTDSNGGVWTTTLDPTQTQTPNWLGEGGYRMPYGTVSSWGNVTGTTCGLPANQTCLPIQVDEGSGVSISWGWSAWLFLAVFIAVI